MVTDGVKRMVDHFLLVQNQSKTLTLLQCVCPSVSGPELRHQHPDYRGRNIPDDSQDTDGEVQIYVAQGMVDHFCLFQEQTKTAAVLLHACPADQTHLKITLARHKIPSNSW